MLVGNGLVLMLESDVLGLGEAVLSQGGDRKASCRERV